jgi:hypothetical protein
MIEIWLGFLVAVTWARAAELPFGVMPRLTN